MLKGKAKNSRNLLTKDKRIAIADYVLDYVRRNPGKQIPTSKIGELAQTPSYNVSTIIRQLVRTGEIKQLSRYTYEINTAPKPKSLPPVQKVASMAAEVEALAKEYVWTAEENHTLRGFIEWLKANETKA